MIRPGQIRLFVCLVLINASISGGFDEYKAHDNFQNLNSDIANKSQRNQLKFGILLRISFGELILRDASLRSGQDKKGIWLSESALKRYTKQRFLLHSDSIQAVIEKFCGNLKSAHALRKENENIRYPYKNKSWFCVHVVCLVLISASISRALMSTRHTNGKRKPLKSKTNTFTSPMANAVRESYSNCPSIFPIATLNAEGFAEGLTAKPQPLAKP